MSENSKPLIFLEPLSETLKKLKEVLEENSEAEGIEIFDVESVDEASQLIPTIGQAVILTASPKTCAITLQSNRKYIKKLQTKTLLLTPKPIPRKTLDKFMKVGLTECIVEPVNPKTLLYKVRLQLRSIVAEKNDEDGEMQNKFGDDSGREAVDTQTKMRAEKGVILEEDAPEAKERKKKEAKEEVLEDYTKPKKKPMKEESIDGFYRGKQKRAEVELDDEGNPNSKKKGYQEEIIEGHYKGKVERQEAPEAEPQEKKEKFEEPELEESVESIKRQINIEVEEDYKKKRREEIQDGPTIEKLAKSPTLDIEEEDEDKVTTREAEDLGGHYKGDVNKNHLDVEDDEDEGVRQEKEAEELSNMKGKTSQTLNIEDDEEEYRDKEEVSEEIITKKKSKPLAVTQDDDEEEYLDRPELNIVEDEQEKNLLNEEEEVEEISQKKTASLTIEEDEEDDEVDAKKVDDIDGYLRGGKAKKNIDIEDDPEDLYKDEKLEEEREKKKKDMAALDLYDDDSGKDPLLGEKEYGSEESHKKKSTQLNISDDEYGKKEKGERQDDSDGLDRARSSYKEEDQGGYGKKHSAHTQKKEERHNKSNARADHIKTHYSSRESIKHNEGDWDSNWEKAGVAEQDFGANNAENEISYESEDLGEQTIDYARLKEEFEGMDLSGIRKKKKEYGEFDQIAEVKTYTKSVVSPTGSLESMEFEEVNSDAEEEEESHQVYLPDSKGMEIVIEVLNFYQRDKVKLTSIFNFISMKINDQFNGDLTLYIMNEKNELNLFHMGSVIRELGMAPVRPTEEDALDKKEFKLLIKEYEEEDREYKTNALNIRSDWKEKWEVRLDEWKACQTPKWWDHTFQAEDNEFIFPFYEGISLMGIAIFTPHEDFMEVRSGALEVALESLRAPMLTEYHEARGAGQQRSKTTKKEDSKDSKGSKGFFGKLFGKKAG